MNLLQALVRLVKSIFTPIELYLNHINQILLNRSSVFAIENASQRKLSLPDDAGESVVVGDAVQTLDEEVEYSPCDTSHSVLETGYISIPSILSVEAIADETASIESLWSLSQRREFVVVLAVFVIFCISAAITKLMTSLFPVTLSEEELTREKLKFVQDEQMDISSQKSDINNQTQNLGNKAIEKNATESPKQRRVLQPIDTNTPYINSVKSEHKKTSSAHTPQDSWRSPSFERPQEKPLIQIFDDSLAESVESPIKLSSTIDIVEGAYIESSRAQLFSDEPPEQQNEWPEIDDNDELLSNPIRELLYSRESEADNSEGSGYTLEEELQNHVIQANDDAETMRMQHSEASTRDPSANWHTAGDSIKEFSENSHKFFRAVKNQDATTSMSGTFEVAESPQTSVERDVGSDDASDKIFSPSHYRESPKTSEPEDNSVKVTNEELNKGKGSNVDRVTPFLNNEYDQRVQSYEFPRKNLEELEHGGTRNPEASLKMEFSSQTFTQEDLNYHHRKYNSEPVISGESSSCSPVSADTSSSDMSFKPSLRSPKRHSRIRVARMNRSHSSDEFMRGNFSVYALEPSLQNALLSNAKVDPVEFFHHLGFHSFVLSLSEAEKKAIASSIKKHSELEKEHLMSQKVAAEIKRVAEEPMADQNTFTLSKLRYVIAIAYQGTDEYVTVLLDLYRRSLNSSLLALAKAIPNCDTDRANSIIHLITDFFTFDASQSAKYFEKERYLSLIKHLIEIKPKNKDQANLIVQALSICTCSLSVEVAPSVFDDLLLHSSRSADVRVRKKLAIVVECMKYYLCFNKKPIISQLVQNSSENKRSTCCYKLISTFASKLPELLSLMTQTKIPRLSSTKGRFSQPQIPIFPNELLIQLVSFYKVADQAVLKNKEVPSAIQYEFLSSFFTEAHEYLRLHIEEEEEDFPPPSIIEPVTA